MLIELAIFYKCTLTKIDAVCSHKTIYFIHCIYILSHVVFDKHMLSHCITQSISHPHFIYFENQQKFEYNPWLLIKPQQCGKLHFWSTCPKNRCLSYVLHKIPLAQANFHLAQLKIYSHYSNNQLKSFAFHFCCFACRPENLQLIKIHLAPSHYPD